jgi:hypothetical protein
MPEKEEEEFFLTHFPEKQIIKRQFLRKSAHFSCSIRTDRQEDVNSHFFVILRMNASTMEPN